LVNFLKRVPQILKFVGSKRGGLIFLSHSKLN
jgi:hypothetical protein